jgi:hypothetical protein
MTTPQETPSFAGYVLRGDLIHEGRKNYVPCPDFVRVENEDGTAEVCFPTGEADSEYPDLQVYRPDADREAPSS